MGDAARDDRALKGARRGVLADEVAKRARAVLAVERLVLRHIQSPFFATPPTQSLSPRGREIRGSDLTIGGRAPPLRSKTPSSHRGSRLRPRWLRHPLVSPYRCFLPDLTGFGDPSCAGPDLQRRLPRPVLRTQTSATEFGPAKADCRFRVPPAPHLARPPLSLPGLRRPGLGCPAGP